MHTWVNTSFVNFPHSMSSNALSKLNNPLLPFKQFPVIFSSSIVCTFCTCILILVHSASLQPKDTNPRDDGPQSTACCCSYSDPQVLVRDVVEILSPVLSLQSPKKKGEWRVIFLPTWHIPFLTWGSKASKSFIRCLIWCVIPLKESRKMRQSGYGQLEGLHWH